MTMVFHCPYFYDGFFRDKRKDQRMQQLTMLSSEGWCLHANHKHRVRATMTTTMSADTQNLSDS